LKRFGKNFLLLVVYEKSTNKLIRQYIPKKTNFDTLNNQQIKEIQYKINNIPRKNLNFYSPKEIFLLNLQNKKVAFSC
jgi:IS30 family transposase